MPKYIVGQNSIMDSKNSSPRMITAGEEIPENIIENYRKNNVLDILLKDGRIKEVKEDKEENQEEVNKEQNQEANKEESQEENTEQSQETIKEESQEEVDKEQNQEANKEESQEENIEQNQQAEVIQKSAKQSKAKK